MPPAIDLLMADLLVKKKPLSYDPDGQLLQLGKDAARESVVYWYSMQ